MIQKSLVLMLAAGGLTTAASAQVQLTWGFTELDAAYNESTGIFTLSSLGAFATTGDVTLTGIDTASFLPGSMDNATGAHFHLEMTISDVTASSATGAGVYSIWDGDEDMITGNFSGEWILTAFGIEFFNGPSADASYVDDGNGIFEGSSGSFATPDKDYLGGVSILLFQPDMFQDTFRGVSSSADGQFVPTPGALILAGIGGMLAFRRQR